jgi:hypothetical protein
VTGTVALSGIAVYGQSSGRAAWAAGFSLFEHAPEQSRAAAGRLLTLENSSIVVFGICPDRSSDHVLAFTFRLGRFLPLGFFRLPPLLVVLLF